MKVPGRGPDSMAGGDETRLEWLRTLCAGPRRKSAQPIEPSASAALRAMARSVKGRAGMLAHFALKALGKRLLDDHAALDASFDALLAAMHGGDAAACQASWSRFEQGLLAHMDAEEVFLLPAFERIDPAETIAIRQEHATLRHLLADMGVRLELHAVREEHVKRMVETLRGHARREELVLYRWAENVAPEIAEAIAKRLTPHLVVGRLRTS